MADFSCSYHKARKRQKKKDISENLESKIQGGGEVRDRDD